MKKRWVEENNTGVWGFPDRLVLPHGTQGRMTEASLVIHEFLSHPAVFSPPMALSKPLPSQTPGGGRFVSLSV